MQKYQPKNTLSTTQDIKYQTVYVGNKSSEDIQCLALDKDENTLVIGMKEIISIFDISNKIAPKEKQIIELRRRISINRSCICFSQNQWFAFGLENEIQIYKETKLWIIEIVIKSGSDPVQHILINDRDNELIWKSGRRTISVSSRQFDSIYGLQHKLSIQDLNCNKDATELVSADFKSITIWHRINNKWRKKQTIIQKSIYQKVFFLNDSLIAFCQETSESKSLFIFKKNNSLQIINQVIKINLFTFDDLPDHYHIQIIQGQIIFLLGMVQIFQLQANGTLKQFAINFTHFKEGVFTNDGQYFIGQTHDRQVEIQKLI